MATTSSVPSRQALVRHLLSQFERPRGPLGHLAGRIMASRGSNRDRNRWLIEQLDPEPRLRGLEIGPGPGVALGLAGAAMPESSLVGVDHSTTMLAQAARRNRALVRAERLQLIEGSAQALPTDLGRFDRIWSMNVWQFWADQEAVLASLVERLEPGGLLAIGYQPRHPGATAADTDAAGRCLRDQLVEVGLVAVEVGQLDLEPVPVTMARGRRSS